MDKIVSIKRKAQRFVQAGHYDKAVAEYERLLETGDLDPYDYVYIGDLLVRTGSLDSAVDRYREAIAAYERVSLFKNAIAVGKKILRIRPESFDMHRLVGGLYYLEGLYTDSLFYYMQYLSSAPPEQESAAIEEAGIRLLTMPLPSTDVALRIVEAMVAANRGPASARPLLRLAVDFESRGSADEAAVLRKRALELDPDAGNIPVEELRHDSGEFDPSASFAPSIDPSGFGTGDFRLRDLDTEDSTRVGANGVSLDFGSIRLPGDSVIDLDGSAGGTESSVAGQDPVGPGLGAVPAFFLEAEAPEPEMSAELAELDPDQLLARAGEMSAAGDTGAAMDAWLAAGQKLFEIGESRRAEDIYVNMVGLDPNHLGALKGLTEIAHINGERAKMVRYGCELGDVYLSLEKYALAKLEFERVLQFDPKNEKARSRVTRLNSIEGMEQVTATPLAPVASEMRGASVTVRGEPSKTQTIMDLSEILNEFQNAVAGQVADDDAQSHYDLGMTYLEMEMREQALAEFELARKSPDHKGRAVEMMARCYIECDRAEDAVRVIDEIVNDADIPAERLAGLFAFRGQALEALNQPEEAIPAYRMALSLDRGLDTAVQGLQRLKDSEAA